MVPVPGRTVKTPMEEGFHMPAEWELQESVWLSWPIDEETFPDLPAVEDAYGAIIRASCHGQKVNLLVRDGKTAAYYERYFEDLWESSGGERHDG